MADGPLVLMTTDTVGGVLTYALELSRALCDRGATVALATMGARMSGAHRALAARIPRLNVLESSFKLEWMDGAGGDVERAGEWLLRLAERARPDVVHVNGYAHGALPFRCPVVVVAHSCVLSWWRAVHGEDAPARYDGYRAAALRGIAAADAVVAPTQAMLDAVRLLHAPPARAAVIPNGVCPEPFVAAQKNPFVLAAGRAWDEAKNLQALGRVAGRLPWAVAVAGSDEPPDGERRPVRGVSPLGELGPTDVRRWMAHAAIYALPARYEPFGLSVLEAALSGCALVLGDIPSLREVWGEAALYAAPDDDGALERAILALIESPALRAGMAARARARALPMTAARMAQAYLDLYASLGAAGEEVPIDIEKEGTACV